MRTYFQEFLGYITCDAYVSCQVLENESDGKIQASDCLIHCRRYFPEAFFVRNVADMICWAVYDRQLPKGQKAVTCMVIGYPAVKYQRIAPRKDMKAGVL